MHSRIMSDTPSIGPLEELVLLAIQVWQPVYVADIVAAINQAGYGFSDESGSMHNILDRLEAKQLVFKHLTEPRHQRGGRRRKSYQLTVLGRRAIERAELMREMVRQSIVPQSA